MKLLLVLSVVVFWNVENLFNPKAQSTNASELSFTPDGEHHWTRKRLEQKCLSISKTIFAIADSLGEMPVAVGLCEVEDAFCLKQLTHETLLRKWGYDFVHFESKDPRGIDCALLYRPSALGKARGSQHFIVDGTDTLETRSLLVAEFDSLSVVVVHLPSKLGLNAPARRTLALKNLGVLCDSLLKDGKPVIALGDFNDTWSALSDSLMYPMSELSCPGRGSYKFNGEWEFIDRAFVGGGEAKMEVWNSPSLSEPDKKFGGVKPRRTYIGPRYNGGVSDHYPIAVSLLRRR